MNDIRDGNATWHDLSNLRKECLDEQLTINSIRRGKLLIWDYLLGGWIKNPNNKQQTITHKTLSLNRDGTQNSEGKFYVDDEENLKNSEYLIRLHNYDPAEWNLINSKNSVWDVQDKNGQVKKLYSSKITVEPKTISSLSLKEIDQYFSNKNWDIPVRTSVPTNYEDNDDFLEIDLADAHIGLLSHYQETGNNYDINIAVEIVHKCIDDIIQRIDNKKFSKIYYCCLGDILHIDSYNNSTFKGTPQSVDSRFHKIFDSAMDLQISVIERLSSLSHVVVPYVMGNHDKTSGYSLIKGIEQAFRKSENVTFDSRPIPRKIIKEGKVLIGLSHGNISKKNADNWLISEFKKEFADATFVECHSGHYHSLRTTEEEDKTILYRTLPTICHHSSWEYEEGYPQGLRAVLSFVWNKNKGLRDIWISNPNVL